MSITTVLNVYKRPYILREQTNAILAQTVKSEKIFIWNNGNRDIDFSEFKNDDRITFFDCNKNLGVWARFIAALNSNTEYICIFDDDTIPGRRWFENCLETIKDHDGVLGTIGVIFDQGNVYTKLKRWGWEEGLEKTKEVDIVGHNWFFKRKYLENFVKDLPNMEKCYNVGEDIHFSFMLQKHQNLKAYIPKHPLNNLHLWGSLPSKAWKYGKNGIFDSVGGERFNNFLADCIKMGYETMNNKGLMVRTYNLSIEYFINRIKKQLPFAISRYGDGEFFILNNHPTMTDGWIHLGHLGSPILKKQLEDTLQMDKTNYFFGISAPCDKDNHKESFYEYYVHSIKGKSTITFANIFCNKNYDRFLKFLQTADLNIVLISSNNPGKIEKLKIIDFYKTDIDLVNKWDKEYETHIKKINQLSKTYTNTLFFVSCGPIAKVLIYNMYDTNPNNMYMDVGSCIDPYTKGKETRDYHKKDSYFRNKTCVMPI